MPDAGVAVRWLDAVPSTQEVAHLLAEGGAPHGTAVAAREQLAGRGTRGRSWQSPLGGLWMSVVCRPTSSVTAECFSIRVGLAVAAAIEASMPEAPAILLKWPNDLYLDARKLGGILCEARWQGADLAWIVAGIGLNVRNRIPDELQDTAVALATAAADAAPEELAGPIAARVAAQSAAGGPLTPDEVAAFAKRDFLHGRLLRGPIAGRGAGIDPGGGLIVALDGGGFRLALTGTVQLEEGGRLATPEPAS